VSGLTRAQFLKAAAAFAAAARRFEAELGIAAPAASAERFVSRADLRPPLFSPLRGTTGDLLLLAPSSGPGQHGPMIVDAHGALVWFRPTAPLTAMDFKVQRLHGRPVLTWWQGRSIAGLSHGEWVIVDAAYREIARFGAARGRNADEHELLISPENTALVTCTEVRPWRHGQVVGGVVQELALPSGRLIREWRSLDHISPAETAIAARPGPRFDYFHINSIDVGPDGNLVVSARNTWAAYGVHRTSGRLLWRLGGKHSSFAHGPGAHWWWQHDVRRHGATGLTIFDNGAAPAREKQSRALLLDLDLRRRRVTLRRAFTHRPELVLSHFMGNVQTLGDGHLFVGWGGSPYATEFAADGTIAFDGRLPHGGQSYRAFRFAWTGRPARPPDLAVAHGTAYASWNGATVAASWRLVEDGRDTQTVQRSGFETALRPAASTRRVSVVALDARGAPLGRSATVDV
jgi:hypothetical protein